MFLDDSEGVSSDFTAPAAAFGAPLEVAAPAAVQAAGEGSIKTVETSDSDAADLVFSESISVVTLGFAFELAYNDEYLKVTAIPEEERRTFSMAEQGGGADDEKSEERGQQESLEIRYSRLLSKDQLILGGFPHGFSIAKVNDLIKRGLFSTVTTASDVTATVQGCFLSKSELGPARSWDVSRLQQIDSDSTSSDGSPATGADSSDEANSDDHNALLITILVSAIEMKCFILLFRTELTETDSLRRRIRKLEYENTCLREELDRVKAERSRIYTSLLKFDPDYVAPTVSHLSSTIDKRSRARSRVVAKPPSARSSADVLSGASPLKLAPSKGAILKRSLTVGADRASSMAAAAAAAIQFTYDSSTTKRKFMKSDINPSHYSLSGDFTCATKSTDKKGNAILLKPRINCDGMGKVHSIEFKVEKGGELTIRVLEGLKYSALHPHCQATFTLIRLPGYSHRMPVAGDVISVTVDTSEKEVSFSHQSERDDFGWAHSVRWTSSVASLAVSVELNDRGSELVIM